MGLVRINQVKRGFSAKDGLCADLDIMNGTCGPTTELRKYGVKRPSIGCRALQTFKD